MIFYGYFLFFHSRVTSSADYTEGEQGLSFYSVNLPSLACNAKKPLLVEMKWTSRIRTLDTFLVNITLSSVFLSYNNYSCRPKHWMYFFSLFPLCLKQMRHI